MKFGLIFRTVRHLKTTQVVYQVLNRVHKPSYRDYSAPKHEALKLLTEPITRYNSLDGDVFTFLNMGHKFNGWGFAEYGNLWLYNQLYFDWINQEGMTMEEGRRWIDLFISCLHVSHGYPRINGDTSNNTRDTRDTRRPSWSSMALDPYPIALRGINWSKFFCRYPEAATKEREDSLYSQYKLLEKKLEYHLLGNHLLEDAYSLFIGSLYFEDKVLYEKASKLLKEQLEEQTLMDGDHYEQSPMYHCILLDRLLDCINFGKSSLCEKSDKNLIQNQSRIRELENSIAADILTLTSYAQRMLGHLESIVWSDKTIPLLNDSANGIAPTAEQIFDYAKRLELEWEVIPMKECGYRKFKNDHLEAIIDVGNISATYQPGHTHADTFNYELRIDGKPFIVDTGISTYNKNERRQYERSSAAHNCVCALVDGKLLDSSEVWGGFRVGRRASLRVSHESQVSVSAEHDGYGKPCARTFTMTDDAFTIEDSFDGEAVSLIHLAPGVEVEGQESRGESYESRGESQEVRDVRTSFGVIKTEGGERVEIVDEKASTEYNRFETIKVLRIYYRNHLKYTIQ